MPLGVAVEVDAEAVPAAAARGRVGVERSGLCARDETVDEPAVVGGPDVVDDDGVPCEPGTIERLPSSPTISLSLRPMTAPPAWTRSAPVTRRLAPALPKLLAARLRLGMTGRSCEK